MALVKPTLSVLLAAPRGFCAGVDRAIQIVEKALEAYGPPVYVRHEIVHNRFVVEALRAKGAIFVEELDEVPDDGRPVIFSAHGVPKSVPQAARARAMFFIDATCPLVTKVHNEAIRHHHMGYQLVLVGHAGHPEVVGTMGQLPEGEVLLVETVADVERITPRDPARLAYGTQTTLSVDDTAEIVAALRARFPAIMGPGKEDICYATTNRQAAVKAIAPKVEALIVIGSSNSSNSNRLAEVARAYGCSRAWLIDGPQDIRLEDVQNIKTLGLTAGASAPEQIIQSVVAKLSETFDVQVQEVEITREDVVFNIPKVLREAESLRPQGV